MKDNDEINPVSKKEELCSLIEKLNYQYEVHESNLDKDYEYLNENDICITILNKTSEEKMYIDLEYNGELTLSYYMWHMHYYPDEENYNILCENLIDILNNNKCVIIINSNKRWLSSGLSNEKVGMDYNYKNDIIKLPEEFQDEIKELGGNIELFYWDVRDNIIINI